MHFRSVFADREFTEQSNFFLEIQKSISMETSIETKPGTLSTLYDSGIHILNSVIQDYLKNLKPSEISSLTNALQSNIAIDEHGPIVKNLPYIIGSINKTEGEESPDEDKPCCSCKGECKHENSEEDDFEPITVEVEESSEDENFETEDDADSLNDCADKDLLSENYMDDEDYSESPFIYMNRDTLLYDKIDSFKYDELVSTQSVMEYLNKTEEFRAYKKKHGFEPCETWVLSDCLAQFLYPRLVAFKKLNTCAIPFGETEEEYNAILNKMIIAVRILVLGTEASKQAFAKEVQEGCELIGKYFTKLNW